MKRSMITICGDFSDRYRISDVLLTHLARLANALGQNDCEVVYADSMDYPLEPQIKNQVKNIEACVGLAVAADADTLFVIYRGEKGKNNLYASFKQLRELLPRKTALVLINLGKEEALTRRERVLLAQLKGMIFWHTGLGYSKETMQTLLKDAEFEIHLMNCS